MYTGAAANAIVSNLQRSQDTLWTLAADTGGKALLDYNDLTRGIVQAQTVNRELLHPRLLHHERKPGRQVPQDQDHPRQRAASNARLPPGLLRR